VLTNDLKTVNMILHKMRNKEENEMNKQTQNTLVNLQLLLLF